MSDSAIYEVWFLIKFEHYVYLQSKINFSSQNLSVQLLPKKNNYISFLNLETMEKNIFLAQLVEIYQENLDI